MITARKEKSRVAFIFLLLLGIVVWLLLPFHVKAQDVSGTTTAQQEQTGEEKAYKLLKTVPEDGAILSATPKEVRLTFAQPTEIEYASIFDNRNKEYSTGKIKINPEDPRQVILTTAKELSPGTYGVEWVMRTAPSANKKDPNAKLRGQIYFAIQSLSPTPKGGGAGLVEQLSRETLPNWVVFWGMAVSFGGTFFVRYIAREKEYHKRWQYWQIPIYFLTSTAALVLFLVRNAAIPEVTPVELASLRIGWVPLVHFFMFALIFGITYTRWTLPFLGLALMLNVIVGRSYTVEYGGWMAMLMNGIHLFALSIWLGGVFALLVVAPKEGKWKWFREKGAEFSRWAMISIVLLILTGIAMTVDYAPTWDEFIRSVWGISILVKAGLVILIVLLGCLQMRYVRKGTEKGVHWFVRKIRWELWLGATALLIAGALVNFVPAVSKVDAAPVQVTKQGITVYATISPFVAGFNDVKIQFDKDAPEFKEVYVRFSELAGYNVVNRAFVLGKGSYAVSGDQMRSPSSTYVNVEAITQDGKKIVFTFPPRGTAWCDI